MFVFTPPPPFADLVLVLPPSPLARIYSNQPT